MSKISHKITLNTDNPDEQLAEKYLSQNKSLTSYIVKCILAFEERKEKENSVQGEHYNVLLGAVKQIQNDVHTMAMAISTGTFSAGVTDGNTLAGQNIPTVYPATTTIESPEAAATYRRTSSTSKTSKARNILKQI